MLPVRPDRQYRAIQTLLTIGQEKRFETDFYVEGYATTFDQPYMLGEIDDTKYFEVIARDALNCDIDVICKIRNR